MTRRIIQMQWLFVAAMLGLVSIPTSHADRGGKDYTSSSTKYNSQNSVEWPTTGEWLGLARSLSKSSAVFGPFHPADYEKLCGPDGLDDYSNPFEIAVGGQGICMQYDSCVNEFCLEENVGDDLPAYVVKASTENDITLGVKFANKYNIQLSVKSSGHSILGASTAKDSLMIWLAHYTEDSTVKTGYLDSCGDNSTRHDVIGVSAGQNFNSIADKVGDSYHFVSASEASVSASGGWIQGGGLSHTSRKYGLGVDNVIDFRVVLPSGNVVIADRCINTDLFWALRGGGGGTFGIVTHMHYKLHPVTPVIHFDYDFEPFAKNTSAIGNFMKFWVNNGPNLDNRWGGSFSGLRINLYFAGRLTGAKMTFLDDFSTWIERESEMFTDGYFPVLEDHIKEYSSYSEVLKGLSQEGAQEYITQSSFSRLVPTEMAKNKPEQLQLLLQSLAISQNLGDANYLLGGKINDIRGTETSVNPILRESTFLLSANQYGYEKMLETLPNTVSGIDKNHHGALEPDWKNSIWGDNYSRLNEIKNLIDPNKVFNCYQSVGYEGPEVDAFNLNTLTPAPTPVQKGDIDLTSSAESLRLRAGTVLVSICVYVLAL